MITLPQHPEANQALGEAAERLRVRGISAAEYVPAAPSSREEEDQEAPAMDPIPHNRYRLDVLGEAIEIDSTLAGVHQQRNLALAIAAAATLRNNYGYNISPQQIEEGIRRVVWPGRLEFVGADGLNPDILLDVGHNPAGAWALRAAISKLDRGQALTLVFGCLADKPVEELAQILFPCFQKVVLTEVDSPRSASISRLLDAAEATGSPAEAASGPIDALERASTLTPANGLAVVCGSVYLVGKIREQIIPVPHEERRSSTL
jgi:dihydrofolate synthase/folylpolyglutamate synthase